jgi:hypothetical protein
MIAVPVTSLPRQAGVSPDLNRARPSLLNVIVLAAIILFGISLRLPPFLFAERGSLHWLHAIHPQPGFDGLGFDEGLYRNYVEALSKTSFTSYPDLAEMYVKVQRKLPSAILPPTRFLYIAAGYLCHQFTGSDSLSSLKIVSSLFSILALALAALFATSMAGWRIGIGATALFACAPTQIHMSQHALIDGTFAFVAVLCLWLLWENLHRPSDWRWLIPYILGLALLVITKENALFAYVGLLASLGAARIFRFGTVNRLLLAATLIGPLLGVAILVNLCGSFSTTIHIYQLLATKAAALPYAIKTGDGPWYRYMVDLLLVSPLVFLFALGAIFTLRRGDFASIFLLSFLGLSYLIMCNIPFGLNLRYANMWDFPMRFLTAAYLAHLFADWRKPVFYYSLAIAVACLVDLRQYQLLFVRFNLYELVPEGLLRALHILK